MLPKPFRFSREEFDHIRRIGKLSSGRRLAVLIGAEAVFPGNVPKIGMIVSKKISRRAVDRNLLKRRLRAAVRELIPELPSSTRAVILPRRSALDTSVDELKRELRVLLVPQIREQ